MNTTTVDLAGPSWTQPQVATTPTITFSPIIPFLFIPRTPQVPYFKITSLITPNNNNDNNNSNKPLSDSNFRSSVNAQWLQLIYLFSHFLEKFFKS